MSTTTDARPTAALAGPAVRVDLERLRPWVTAWVDKERDGVFSLTDTSDLLAALAAASSCGWTVCPAVDAIGFWPIFDGDYDSDGAFISVTTANGLRLRSAFWDNLRWLPEADLSVPAAAKASAWDVFTVLGHVAALANEVLADLLGLLAFAAPFPGEDTDREVVVYVRSEEQLRQLERAIGVRVYELGWRGQHTLDHGVRLDRQYRLDEAITFARLAGVRYVDIVETTTDHQPRG